jgi:alkylhydroperoxidase family enzyme
MPAPNPRDRLLHDLEHREGALDLGVRRAILARAKVLRGDPAPDDVPAHLRTYVDKVAKHAYKVTDEDIEALQAKHGTREIYEITVAASVGAALARRETAIALLRGGKS